MKIIQSGVFHASIDDYDNAELFRYDDTASNVIVPDEIDGYKVTKLGKDLFKHHKEIESFVLPACLKEIGSYAFLGCSGLKSPIIIPEEVCEIGDRAFYSYPLCEINLLKHLKKIHYQTFAYSKLKSISIPDSVTEIERSAFEHTMLEEIVIPENVKILQSSAFTDCNYLRRIFIGSGVCDGFRYGGLKGCTALEEIRVSPENKYICDIDGVLFDKEVTRLIKYPAQKTSQVYVIPETVTKICYNAFESAKVHKVVCPENLKEISSDAFSSSSLKYINIPEDIEWFEFMSHHRDESWYGLPLGITFEISGDHPNYIVKDGKLARREKPSSSTSVITKQAGKRPENDEYILDGVRFRKANPNGIYDRWTLPGDHGILLLSYPAKQKLETTYRIPDGTEKINEYAFRRVNHLKRVIIPPSVKTIFRQAFSSCLSLEEILIEDGCEVVIWENAFFCNEKLAKIIIPKSVTNISDYAINKYPPDSISPVIYGEKDSMAEYFAIKKQWEFRLL